MLAQGACRRFGGVLQERWLGSDRHFGQAKRVGTPLPWQESLTAAADTGGILGAWPWADACSPAIRCALTDFCRRASARARSGWDCRRWQRTAPRIRTLIGDLPPDVRVIDKLSGATDSKRTMVKGRLPENRWSRSYGRRIASSSGQARAPPPRAGAELAQYCTARTMPRVRNRPEYDARRRPLAGGRR
jgi:hypothetical protein